MISRQLHVLVLADGVFPLVVGGMQKHSASVITCLVDRGHKVTLGHFVLPGKAIPGDEEVKRALGLPSDSSFNQVCITFPQLGKMPGHYLRESYLCSRMLFNRLKQILPEVDVIYAKGFMAWYFLDIRRKKRWEIPPVAVKFHGLEMFQRHAGLKEWFAKKMLQSPVRWNLRHADCAFSYGGKITSLIRSLGVPASKICEVPSGIERSWCIDRVEPHSNEIRFLFIGRFERRKGVQELNSALIELNGIPGWRMDFIGPVPASHRLKQSGVTYHGQITEREKLWSIMDQCDVLVVPSWSEGMPNVILEGMARGLAVLATDVGAVSIAVDENCGWLMPRSEVNLIAEKVKSILAMKRAEIENKRSGARKRVEEKFLWEDVSALLEEQFFRIKAVND